MEHNSLKPVGCVSSDALKQLVLLFGDRPDPMHPRVRFPMRGCEATARRTSGDPGSFRIQVVDLAFGGIGFLTDSNLAIGTDLVIEFDAPHVSSRVWPCRVTRADRRRNGQFLVGGEFEMTSAPTKPAINQKGRNRDGPGLGDIRRP